MTSIMLVPAKYSKSIVIPQATLKKLPRRVMLFSSVQFLHQLPEIAKQLESAGISVVMVKSKNFLYDGMISEKGQLLGCNAESFNSENYGDEFDAFLYIGDGMFHPKALLVNNRRDIYCYDPKIDKLSILGREMHDELQRRNKGNILKFLSSKNIGILVTTKRGQNSSRRVDLLKVKMRKKWPDKEVFVFYCSEINFAELENFNFVDVYVNSACSRIGHDDTTRSPKPIINISDVEALINA